MTDIARTDLDRAESIFWAVRTLTASEREAVLDRECGEQGDLRDLILDLLGADSVDLTKFLPPADPSVWTDREPEVLSGRLGKYDLIGVLGRGGMGAVYEAEDPGLGRRVAIKLFPAELERRVPGLDRIEEEARLLARLNHPGIATIHSIENSEDGRHFFTLELAHGETLHDRAGHRTLTAEQVFSLGAQIADALSYAHDEGVVHRDLKPDNVKISPQGQVKILDFGIGALLEKADGPSTDPERTRIRFGTPGFASPDQLLGAAPTAADDLWSLGALLFYALTGRSPVTGSDPAELSRSTISHELSWGALPPECPEALRSILERLLSREASLRGTSAELRDELEPWVTDSAQPLTKTVESESPVPNNLSPAQDRFVGRARELTWLARAFETPGVVSVVAVGGAGKSRLALEYARRNRRRFPGGVWFIELARIPREVESLESGPRVLDAIARELGIRTPSLGSLFDALATRMSQSECLLVLDNCEHIAGACLGWIERLRSRSPNLSVLTTSRVPLGAKGESLLHLELLRAPRTRNVEFGSGPDIPIAVEELAHLDSVRLLVDRLRAFHPALGLTDRNAGTIAAICEQLEGHPLSLELVAARSRVLGLDEIRSRLEDRLGLLSQAERSSNHGSLRATLEWSWELLSDEERLLLSRLSIFRAGFTVSAVAEVCAGNDGGDDSLNRDRILDLMEALIDHSLVRVSSSGDAGDPRHSLLEVVREFAESRLALQDRPTLERRHRDSYLAWVREAKKALGSEQSALWLDRLETEAGNLQSAIDWMRRTPAEADTWLDFVGTLGNYWYLRGAFSQGARECSAAVEATREKPPSKVRWQAVVWYAHFVAAVGDLRAARNVYEEALDTARRIGDGFAIAETLRSLAMLYQNLGEPAEARRRFEQAIDVLRELDDPDGLVGVITGLGNLEAAHGNLDPAERLLEEALELSRQDGGRSGEGMILRSLAGVAFRRRDFETALLRYELGLEIAHEVGDARGAYVTQFNIASTLHARGDFPRALREGRTALRGLSQLEDRPSAAIGFLTLASIECGRGKPGRAAVLVAASRALREDIGLELGVGERGELEDLESRIEAALPPSHRQDCEALGRRMGFGRAVDYACEEPPE